MRGLLRTLVCVLLLWATVPALAQTALQGDMAVSRGGSETIVHPQSRFFTSPPTNTTEAALLTRWDGQLYIVLGQEADAGRWQLRIWWKPFVTLIWLGGMMIALGGVLALVGRERRGWTMKLRRLRARDEEEGWAA